MEQVDDEPERPEWVKCIEDGRRSHEKQSVCGRYVGSEWRFTDATHWLNNAQNGTSRLVGCRDCLSRIVQLATTELGAQ